MRIRDLDGTDDAATWIEPGHVLDETEVAWLRDLAPGGRVDELLTLLADFDRRATQAMTAVDKDDPRRFMEGATWEHAADLLRGVIGAPRWDPRRPVGDASSAVEDAGPRVIRNLELHSVSLVAEPPDPAHGVYPVERDTSGLVCVLCIHLGLGHDGEHVPAR